MMKAIPYQPHLHWGQIKEWTELRGKSPTVELLPKTGRIVEQVAAFFLYQTDSKLGLLENLISNPLAGVMNRSRGVDLCIEALLKDAKELGVEYVMASTCLRSIPRRAKRHGFQIQPNLYQVMTKRVICSF